MSLIILVLLLPSSALEVILLTPCSTSYTHTKFLANFAQAGKELLSLELALSSPPGPLSWRRQSVHTLEAGGS